MFEGLTYEKIMIVISGMCLFLLSGSIHEFAHAISAYVMGDNTAQREGRLTINPQHISTYLVL